jgi:hypothetical protein
MLRLSKDALSLESVRHHMNTKFFDELVAALDTLRKADKKFTTEKSADAYIKASKIESIIAKHSGLNVRFKCSRQMGINAYVFPPHLDKNHPLLTDLHRQYYSNDDAKKRLKKADKAIQGSIDLDTGVVSGVYTKIRSEVFVAAQIVQDEMFTLEEAAAVLAHELGHLMTYYEYLGQNVLTSHVMGDAVAEFTEATTPRRRVELYEVTRKALNLGDDEVETVSDVTDAEVFTRLIVSDVARKTCSATNTPYYDQRTWEALADQFASRIGGGRPLAVALDKIFRYSGQAEYKTNLSWLVTETFTMVFSTVFLPFTLLFMALGDPFEIYDPPVERLERIRRDLILGMKNPKADKEYRTRLKEDVKVIDDLLSKVTERKSVLLSFWKLIRSDVRREFNRAQLIREFEQLKDNDLFVYANTLKTM